MAGLWHFAERQVWRPQSEAALFLSQRPDLPLGSLRAVFHYPTPISMSEAAAEVLRRGQFGHVVARLDESTSAMDEGMIHAMYALLREFLSGCTRIGLGHHSSLAAFQARSLTLAGGDTWRLAAA